MSFTPEELQYMLNAGMSADEVSALYRDASKLNPTAQPFVGKRPKNATVHNLNAIARGRNRNDVLSNMPVKTLNKPRTTARGVNTPAFSANLNTHLNENGFNTAAKTAQGFTEAAGAADDLANLVGKKFNFKNIASFDKGKGLSIGGKNMGNAARLGTGIYQGLNALGGLSEMSDLNEDADSLTSKILTSAAGNPLINSYLTSDDLTLLGKLQRGSYDASADLGDATSNLGNLLSGAGTGALMGLAGGVPGAIIGGIGGLINSGIDNMNAETSNNTARLEALYQNLLNAEQQYRSMRRPNFTGLGIQQQYQNMYM